MEVVAEPKQIAKLKVAKVAKPKQVACRPCNSDEEYEYDISDYLDDLGETWSEHFGHPSDYDSDDGREAYYDYLDQKEEDERDKREEEKMERFIESYKKNVCTYCNKQGHFENRCFEKAQNESVFCGFCNKWNKTKSTMSQRNPIHDYKTCCHRLRARICFCCKKPGHIIQQCLFKKKSHGIRSQK